MEVLARLLGTMAFTCLLEGQTRRKLQLTRCVFRSSAHTSGLNQFRAVRCIRVGVSLHIEDVECVQIDSEIHRLSNWEYLEERKVRRPIFRSSNDGLRKRIIPRWTRIVGDLYRSSLIRGQQGGG